MHTFQDIYRVELPRTQVNQVDWNQIENTEIISYLFYKEFTDYSYRL